jgi:hypothetical protein
VSPPLKERRHVHPEYWTEADHYHFENRISNELRELRLDVERLNSRLTYLLGGLGLLAFVIPIIAPWIRGLLGVPS